MLLLLLQVILTLLAFKCLYPEHMHLTRGNHEAKSMNTIYGFNGEVKAKFNQTMVEVFRETFCWLPLGFVLNNRVLVVHGGCACWCGARARGPALSLVRCHTSRHRAARHPPPLPHLCHQHRHPRAPPPPRAQSARQQGLEPG